MRFNNIDEIIKKGLQESDRQNEVLANLSKNRVWNAIEKPQKQKSLHWGFVTAMAASVSLFLVSVLLVLKLDSTQKELDEVQAQINRGILPSESQVDHPLTDEIATARLDINNEKIPGPIHTNKTAPLPPLVQDTNLAALAKEKRNTREASPIPIIEKKIMDFNPEISIPEFDPLELNEGLVLSGPSGFKIPSETKSKKQGKLKIKIGNGSPAQNHYHSLALHFKL